MPPTRPRKFGRGSCGILGTTCTSLPRTVPGSTRWSAGSPYCHNARSNEVRTTACVNWNPPSWSSSRCTTSSRNPLCGPRVPMSFSTVLDGSLPVLWPHMAQTICKKSVTQETSYLRRMSGLCQPALNNPCEILPCDRVAHEPIEALHRNEVKVLEKEWGSPYNLEKLRYRHLIQAAFHLSIRHCTVRAIDSPHF